jgi:hypothetical protein
MPHFHCYGMARFRHIENYDGSPTRKPLLEDTYLNLLTIDALRLSPEFANLIRKGYSQDLLYGDEGEWTTDSRIEARAR